MVKYIYICSAGHSGSTLLDLLIGSHSRVESLGEITHFPKNLALNTVCSCLQRVRSCPVWLKIIKNMGDRTGINYLNDPYSLNLGYHIAKVIVDRKHQTPIYKTRRKFKVGLRYLELRFGMEFCKFLLNDVYESIDTNFLLYDSAREILHVDMIVDSSKEYLKAVGIYKRRPENVRIIFLTRDGRGVFYSNLKRNNSKKRSLYSYRNFYTRSIPLLKRHVDRKHIIRVRYEDLVKDTRKQLKRICGFVGLEFEFE